MTRTCRFGPGLALLLFAAGCGLSERSDFLVGRQCEPSAPSACDEGESCLPHLIQDMTGRLDDFRCRSKESFMTLENNEEAPLAFCDESMGISCPPGTECRPDKIRVGVGVRPLVCKLPGDPPVIPSEPDP